MEEPKYGSFAILLNHFNEYDKIFLKRHYKHIGIDKIVPITEKFEKEWKNKDLTKILTKVY